ncbi:class I adenylate-forming enzyme family protein [Geodermatophilus sp. SYSU D00710]
MTGPVTEPRPGPAAPTGLAALVRAAAARRPEAPAVVDGVTRLTWAELDALVDRVAAGLAARGLARGDRVAVQLPNGVDWLRAVLGALRAGLVVVPVNTAYTDPELEHVLTDSGASLLVAAAARGPLAGVPVVAGPPEADGPPPPDDDDPAALALLAYTSGTTGRPRGAMLTAAALRANQEQCLAMDPPPVRPDDRVLLVLPLFHLYGLNTGFGLVAATGACAVLVPAFDPRATLDVVERERVTAVPGAPPVYQAWLAVAAAEGGDARLRRALASVRTASSGAALLPAATWRAVRDRAGVQVWEGYGLTEAGPVVASTLATGRAKPECVGGPLPGVEVALREPGGTDAEDGPGELWVRGPNLFSGFWPDGTDGPGDDGWLATGDLAHRDADGDLHLLDRRTDLVLVNGFNVYPAEVERVLDTHPAVAESAVIGVPDPRTGAAVVAVVVPAPGAEVDAAELRAHAAASLARYKVPSSVVVRPALPHSLTGKVRHARLRELGLLEVAAPGAAEAAG